MRKSLGMHVIAGIAGLALALPAAAQDNGAKFAYINSQRIVQEAPGAQDVRRTLESEMQQYRTELQQLEQELQKMIQDYQQQRSTLTAEAREQREQEIRTKQQALQQRAGELDQRAAERQRELVQPIMDRIEEVIEQIRQERGYAMIFDSAPGTSIISADPSLDITDEVLRRLSQTAQSSQR